MAGKTKIAYVITEHMGRTFWNRIGVAFENSDGSLNVKLDALPVNGELHIRDYVPKGSRFCSDDPGPDGPPDDDIPL
jgi:hypothetical protein